MPEICQKFLPIRPWEQAHTWRLPGLSPVEPGSWLLTDDAYGAQMAHRRALMAEKGDAVHRLSDAARPAAEELLQLVVEDLRVRDGYQVTKEHVTCPDGVRVKIDPQDPLRSAGAMVQEDLLIMEKVTEEHVLTGAVLCFPASWSLAEKFMQPMTRIHGPVAEYSAEMARRVQRLFDGLQVDRPIWRANALIYNDPELHQPRREAARRAPVVVGRKWLRVERQALRRLEKSRAVVFSIHTYVVSDRRLAELGIAMPERAET